MDLQLVTEYRNLRLLLQTEIMEALQREKFRGLLKSYDMSYLMVLIETTWIKDCIESSTLLMFCETQVPDMVYMVMNDIDRNNVIRQLLYRRIVACNYRSIPEGELTLVLRPTGLYLYL